MFENEYGRDIAEHTGEHVHIGQLDFDAWAYDRIGDGYTICVRQMPPQPMLDALGDAAVPPTFWTINIANGLTTFLPFAEADLDAPRIAYDTLPETIKAAVVAAAGNGWVWDGVEHTYDITTNEWRAA